MKTENRQKYIRLLFYVLIIIYFQFKRFAKGSYIDLRSASRRWKDTIINNPEKLTQNEYDLVKSHPVIGYDILDEIHSRPDLTIGARWHHERYDGKGYPDGKGGEDIPHYTH